MATTSEMLASLLKQAKTDSDSFYTGQSAVAQNAMDSEIKNLQTALNNAIANEELSRTEADRLYNEGVAQINQQAYQNSDATRLMAHQAGIQNSNQFVAQVQGDQLRTNQARQQNTNDRTLRLNEIMNRINTLRQNADLEMNAARSAYQNNLISLRSESDRMYNERAGNLNQMELDQRYAMDMFNAEKAHEIDMFNRQAALSRSLASSGGGGGSRGGSTSGTTASSTTAKSGLANAVKSYNTARQTTELDNYYTNQQNQRKATTSVVRKNSALNNLSPIKAPAQNASVGTWGAMNMMMKDSGLR